MIAGRQAISHAALRTYLLHLPPLCSQTFILTRNNKSGFTLALPTSTVNSDRPAYGGTCYSDFALGAVATVTMYNSSALSMTTEWTASTTPAQAYAHPIDGIAADYTPSATTTTTAAVGYTGGAAASTATSDSDSAAARRGGGGGSGELKSAGVVAALLAVSAVAFLL